MRTELQKGIYVRKVNTTADFDGIAGHYAENGITMAPILVMWQDPGKKVQNINNKTLKKLARAFDNVGIDPGIWVYPWGGMENKLAARIEWALDECEGLLRWIVLDPELGYQPKIHGHDEACLCARRLIDKTIDVMNESTDLIITSYGGSHMHPSFPWAQLLAGFGSPQFYKAALPVAKSGVEDWIANGWTTLIPSVPSYGPNSGDKLKGYIKGIEEHIWRHNGEVYGWLIWSDRQMDEREWKTIREL